MPAAGIQHGNTYQSDLSQQWNSAPITDVALGSINPLKETNGGEMALILSTSFHG
jgi:hypothetical protein